VFCYGYCWGTSAPCFCFISPVICELTLTYTFLQAAHKINSRHVNITSHSECKFLLSVIFFNNQYKSDLKDNTKPQELQREIHTTGMLLQIHYLCIFCRVFCTQSYGFDVQLDTARGQCHLVKMFKHLMTSVKIILCLESHETIIELSVYTSTHT